MLYLLMDSGSDTYAISTHAVEEVVPYALLKSAPGAPPEIAGILNFRGDPVPVVDAGVLLTGSPCPVRFSTRIVLINMEIADQTRVLGVAGENVTRLHAFRSEDFIEPGVRSGNMPCAGRVAALDDRWVQLLEPEKILTPAVWESLTLAPPA